MTPLRTLAGSLLAVAVALVALVASAAPAAAHINMVESSPAYGETLTEPPRTMTLTFDGRVEPALVHVTVEDGNGTEIGPAERTTEPGVTETVEFAFPELGEGSFKAVWKAYAFDGHLMQGAVAFTVSADVPASPAPSGDPAPSAGVPSGEQAPHPALRALEVQGRFVLYAGLSGLAGAVFWAAATVSPARRRGVDGLVVRTVRYSAAAVAAGAVIRIAVALSTGLGAVDASWEARLMILSGPQVWAWIGVLFAAAVAARISAQTGICWPRPANIGVALAAAAVAVLTVSVSHAATTPRPTAAVVFASLHVAAAAAWVGPVVLLAALARQPRPGAGDAVADRVEVADLDEEPEEPAASHDDDVDGREVTGEGSSGQGGRAGVAGLGAALREFSYVARFAAAVLVITGVRAGIDYTGGAPSLEYTQLLFAKLFFAVALVAPAGVGNHLRLVRSGKGSVDSSWLVAVEIIGFVLVLAAVALLASTPPT